MHEEKEELIRSIKEGAIIHCTTAEQARAALEFFRDEGERLSVASEYWLESNEDFYEEIPNIGVCLNKTGNIGRIGIGAASIRRTIRFSDIAHILTGEDNAAYEIDGAVFDALFPP